MTVQTAFARYESIRPRLPQTRYPAKAVVAATLSDVADHVDGFLLDAFGVLNVGETAIAGAMERIAELRARGKRLCVLSNAASYPHAALVAKYRRLGFDFAADEVLSSRDVAAARLQQNYSGAIWGAIAAEGDDFADLPMQTVDLVEQSGAMAAVDGFLFLSSARWTPAFHQCLLDSLTAHPRPMVIANPDLVAPIEAGLSLEPGLFAHDLCDRLDLPVHWFGKPYPDAFQDGLARLGIPPERAAMVGDTLHTDILGGAAAGMKTVLVTDHGLFRGSDARAYCDLSGIHPDFVIPTT